MVWDGKIVSEANSSSNNERIFYYPLVIFKTQFNIIVMSTIRELLKTSGYSERAVEYYINLVNVGTIENPDAHYIFTDSCGDTMEIFLKISSDVITDATFQAIGCAGSFTSGSALTKMIKGKTLLDCEKLNENNVLDHLGTMPKQKVHCARLAVLTLKKQLNNIKIKSKNEKNYCYSVRKRSIMCSFWALSNICYCEC